ncbi:pyruvate ferredoxin oxidoreductase [Candidatus Falkowbacteria bacterium HGW-Falkowbacteria-1]|jgi:pyruvate ferredoxin oxidoreductase gamma subunit|uniref:Pyruvate ferredoxin oxidoreductase n=1 Tax=Candidatus Falkowbacteria bacterium HGW-Falkowbacteria-1 TaxID=2013768 RepID=A0A2N2E8R4_9BACT|nr:MAG: pyruvate ferredoxin oxidoreductase [Candidatus Falkowbacteria bacterium HGW-Falkowbacteria-1]
MIEIRIHGRGGQGVVVASEILAIAFFKDGKESQAFPHFGVERSGAPIQSFVRVSEEKILTREHVYSPDILIIQDDSLIGKADVFFGLKESSKIFFNSKESVENIFLKIEKLKQLPVNFKKENILTVDATKIALEVFGKNIVNTAMLGALAKFPGLLKIDSAISAIEEKFFDKGKDVVEKNILVIKKVYNS